MMKYLGVMISDDGSMQHEVEAMVGYELRVVGGMHQAILKRRELSKQTKFDAGHNTWT